MSASTATLSPMMRQYQQAKESCGDALLFFRMGDFYELFHEDAKDAARLLQLTLTSRDKGENPVPMAGFPHHQLDSYLAKLIKLGRRAAICEQVEDPKKAKGIVRREITRIVSPGTIVDDGLLDPRASNYLAAIAPGETVGLAWVDLSTGRFLAASFSPEELPNQLARVAPVECLISEDAVPVSDGFVGDAMLTTRPAWAFADQAAQQILTRHFSVQSLEGFGFQNKDGPAIRAAGAILEYLTETQKSSLEHIDRLTPYRAGTTLEIDEATRRSLELVRTNRDASREGSLLSMIDRSVTAMGARMLADWLANPLMDIVAIDGRLDAVEELVADSSLAESLRTQLRGVYDLQRLLARIATGRAMPRDLSFIVRTLASLPKLKAKLTGRRSKLLQDLEAKLDLCPEVRSSLEAALVEDCPLASHDGGIIRDGYRSKLDDLRELTRGGKQWIAEYQAREIERTGIPNIKIGFNKVFGYYLEITHAHASKAPAEYIRKQTIKSAERYITPELKEYEEKVLSAEDRSKDMEYDLFVELRDLAAEHGRAMQATADVLAQLDVLAGLAELARQRGYCRPKLVEEAVLEIIDGRHPVLDITEPEGTFVPNSTIASVAQDDEDSKAGTILLITGPNMAGKSTYIRQVALLTIMAQVGSFVPAKSATLGVADRIFARVGASDELSRGQSTFMVEMVETARILNTATSRSLVILDEIGRGTSTYDGLSLAWSIVEHLHDSIGCRTLFATHYHELTDLEYSLSGVTNLNVAVREWNEEVVFLHQIVPGAADKSYGIHVARLAGVPREVNQRAQEILAQLEDEHLDNQGRPRIAQHVKPQGGELQLSLFGSIEEHPLLDRIREFDVNSTTPIEALATLQAWQDELNEEKKPAPR